MNEIKVIDRGLSVGIYYNGVPMCTTEQLAEAYGTDTGTLRRNYQRNKERYIEDKHYILLTGEELKQYFASDKLSHANASKTRSLYLWTQRGALLHAKSLNTDKAWEVYERLVDFYFDVREGQQTPNTAFKKELPLISPHSKAVIQAIKLLLSNGYRIERYAHNTAPIEPFLGFDDDSCVYIRSNLLYDTYIQMINKGLPLASLEQTLAADNLINNEVNHCLRHFGKDLGYIYSKSANGVRYRLLRFKKAAVEPYLEDGAILLSPIN